MYNKLLTKQEERAMELFWSTEEPLTSKDIMNILCSAEWIGSYVYSLLRSLEKKGLIRVYGSVQYKTQVMKKYAACISKEEFYIRLAIANNVNIQEYIKQAILVALREEMIESEIILE